MDAVDRLFDDVTPVDRGGTRSDLRLATLDGERVVVKTRDRSEAGWLRTEYEVIADLSLDAVGTPDPVLYVESEDRVHLATRYREFAATPPVDCSRGAVLEALDDFVDLLDEIRSLSVDVDGTTPAFFLDRMGWHSSVADGHADGRAALDRAREVVRSTDRKHAYATVHGDLFQHNVGFDGHRPTHLLDWERTGRFDPLYDAAFVEHLLRVCYVPWCDGLSAADLRARFRDRLALDDEERRLLDAYGVWPAYVAWQASLAGDDRRRLPAREVVRATFERAVDRLDA